MLRISGTGASHVGLVRGNNEDSAVIGPHCLLVADGVGGGAAGEVASATTAEAIATAAALRRGDPVDVLLAGVRLAQRRLQAGVRADQARTGMATTLTALITDGLRFALAHLGDSRGFVFRDGTLTRVTRDHTYVQDLVEEGRLDPAQVADHPWRNVVLRTVNAVSPGEPDLTDLLLQSGDRILLATDGLTDLVAEAEMAQTLVERNDDDAVAALLATALARGGRDNVTLVIASVVDGPPVEADARLLGAVGDPANIVLAQDRAESA